ncbi:10418_t:CDS:2 [Diversispora eburnea]|uniref:10418_t:CDS:1 n=1 Tax=Diversispora eburnea TaxID=1213867 RepID=A0A9N8V1D6_9GLOM|nr:10418_t:CDS:2 [Diversispora eburnea]
MSCKTVLAKEISESYRKEIKDTINSKGIHPRLVGFLANQDQTAVKYAEATARTCLETGVDFELRKCNREELEDLIIEANEDDNVHGILVYYPVFGDLYNSVLPYGNRLHGRLITVVNRSEIVGRPLAALLANDGGKVYSVDINSIQEFHRGPGLRLKKHEVHDTNLKLEDIIPISDVVITGVPSSTYKIPTSLLRDGVIVINFAAYKNFENNVKDKASIYVPSVGKVTIAMLERNLLRLYDCRNE